MLITLHTMNQQKIVTPLWKKETNCQTNEGSFPNWATLNIFFVLLLLIIVVLLLFYLFVKFISHYQHKVKLI